jgi:hypothetical protein
LVVNNDPVIYNLRVNGWFMDIYCRSNQTCVVSVARYTTNPSRTIASGSCPWSLESDLALHRVCYKSNCDEETKPVHQAENEPDD